MLRLTASLAAASALLLQYRYFAQDARAISSSLDLLLRFTGLRSRLVVPAPILYAHLQRCFSIFKTNTSFRCWPLFVGLGQRTRKITEFLLGRPLDFDFSLFVRRDPIISSSQPLLLVIAAYAVAMPYIWALAFCMWVSLWWTTVSVILPPSKRQCA